MSESTPTGAPRRVASESSPTGATMRVASESSLAGATMRVTSESNTCPHLSQAVVAPGPQVAAQAGQTMGMGNYTVVHCLIRPESACR